ncbi:MAG: hypothetical protein HUU19_12070 [Phycisphaerales bacterium]|nr:hypothetical protein [Phycisphaerales bacterium]
MNRTFAPFVVTVEGLTERIDSVDHAAELLDRLNDGLDKARGEVDAASAAEMNARRRLGHATLQVFARLGRTGDWHEMLGKLRLHKRTIQEFLRVAEAFTTQGVYDYAKVDAARQAVTAAVNRNAIEVDAKLHAALHKKTAQELNVTNLRALATAYRKALTANHDPNERIHFGMDARSTDQQPNQRIHSEVDARPDRAKPTHEAPTVAGLQVDQGDKVVWSAQLGRWMVEVGEVLYEVHEFADMREGASVEWPGGVTPAGYDDEGEDFDDDENEDYDGDEDGDWDDDDAAFADDDDEPLEDDEEDGESAVGSRASGFTHATPSTVGDDGSEDDESDEEERGARGQQMMMASLFEAASSTARTISGLVDKLQHEALISPRELDEAQHAADTFIAAIADARQRLAREDQP